MSSQELPVYISAVVAFIALWAVFISNVEKIAQGMRTLFRPLTRVYKRVTALLDMPDALVSFQVQIDGIRSDMRSMKLKSLARTIADVSMPIEARYEAGCEYLSLGGNGAIKRMFNEEIVHAYTEWLKARNGVA